MNNQQLAKIFYDIADILEMKDIEWKPRAYRKAAQAIENLSEDVSVIYKKHGIKGLEEIPYVGGRIAEKIEEFLKTNHIKEYEKLKKSIPKHITEIMHIPGLGAKRAKLLYKKLKISSVKDLEKAAKLHKISKLPTFKEKIEENILQGIKLYKENSKRTLLGMALPIANNIVNELRKSKYVNKIVVGGSLRRRLETIGDIDILATSDNPKNVMDLFTKIKDVKRVLAKGPTKSMVLLNNNMQADLRVIENKNFGAALQYFTGNKQHNIKLRGIAIKKGLKLNEYGIFRKNKYIAGKTEQEVYKTLGLKYIEPELRENTGEIESSIKNKLPNLVILKDIKGDLHMHTRKTDGNNTIEEMATAAQKLGYEYICITDHSKSTVVAGGLKEDELLEHVKNIKGVQKKFKIRIFVGSEIDILQDGSLDYSDNILRKLDITSVSVHSRFKLTRKQETNRVIRALENKYVNILNHPTARLINIREPLELDLDEIFRVASEKKKILEINSFPNRLDLKDFHIKRAKEFGCKFSINTDSHHVDNLRYIELGVAQARRGWCEKKDIVNSLSLKEIDKLFKID